MSFDFDESGAFIQKMDGFDFDEDGNPVIRGGKPSGEGGFIASVKSGIGSAIKGAGQAAGDFIPGVDSDNALKRYGQGVIDANPTAIHSLSDVAESPWTAAKEAVGNAGGSVAEMLAVRAIGQGITAAAPLTGPFAPATALAGQAIAWFGPAAIAALPSYGGIRDKQIVNDPANNDDWKSKAIASLGAATVGAIETKFGPQQWALSALTKEGRTALAEKFAETTLAKGIGFGMLKGGAIEGAEELAQNPIEQLASYDDPTSKASLQETAFSGVMGAIGGGVLGGAAGAMFKQSAKPAEPTPDRTPEIFAAPDVDAAIDAAERAITESITQSTGADLFARQAQNPLQEAINRPAEDQRLAPTNTQPDELLNQQLIGANPLMDIARAREDRAAVADQIDQQVQQRKQSEVDAIPVVAAEQNTVKSAVERAATLEAPTALEMAFQRAREQYAPAEAIVEQPAKVEPQKPTEPAIEQPRIIERAPGLLPMSFARAEQVAAKSPELEVVRFPNINRDTGEPNGKFSYTVQSKVDDAQRIPAVVASSDEAQSPDAKAVASIAGDDVRKGQPNRAGLQPDRMGEPAKPVAQVPEAAPVSTVGKVLRKAVDDAEPMSQAHSDAIEAYQSFLTDDAKKSLDSGEMPVFQSGRVTVAITPSAQSPGMVQATRYNDTGAIGDSQYKSVEAAILGESLVNSERLPADIAQQRMADVAEAESAYQAKRDAFNVENASPRSNPQAEAPRIEAPKVAAVGTDEAIPAARQPAAGSAEVQAAGVGQAAVNAGVKSLGLGESTQKRAAVGGEVGPNGEFYKGGAFIATTDMPKSTKTWLAKNNKSGQVQVDRFEAGEAAKADPRVGEYPILKAVGGTVLSGTTDGETINEQYLKYLGEGSNPASPEIIAKLRELANKFIAGERWVKVNDYPEFAGAEDLVRMVVNGQPIPGAALDKFPANVREHFSNIKGPQAAGVAGTNEKLAPPIPGIYKLSSGDYARFQDGVWWKAFSTPRDALKTEFAAYGEMAPKDRQPDQTWEPHSGFTIDEYGATKSLKPFSKSEKQSFEQSGNVTGLANEQKGNVAPLLAEQPSDVAQPAPIEVSRFNGKFDNGMNPSNARIEAVRLNGIAQRENTGITYTAEAHGDPKLENPYAVVGRKAITGTTNAQATEAQQSQPTPPTATKAELTPAQRSVLADAIGEDLEREYQAGIKQDIQRRLGRLPAPKEVADKQSPFKSFLKTYGISDSPSDVVGEGNTFRANQALPSVFRKAGLGMDELAIRAEQNGFITQADIDSGDANGKLVEMVRNELRGEKQLPMGMQDDAAQVANEKNQRQGIESIADGLGLPYDADTPTDRLASMVARIERILAQPRTGLLKADRILRNAREKLARIEAKRAQFEAQFPDFDEAITAEQDAVLDVLIDEDGLPVIIRTRDIDVVEQAERESKEPTNDARANPDSGQDKALAERVTPEGVGNAQENGTSEQRRSNQVEGQQEGLVAPSREDILAQQDRADAATKQNESQRLAADKIARDEEDRKRIAKASEAAAGTFELGGDALDNLTGQSGIFSAPSEQPAKQSRFTSDGVGRSEAEKELQSLSHKVEQPGDVMMSDGSFVAFDTVVKMAREGIESGEVTPFPAQMHFKLDMSMRDAKRVLDAATKPETPAKPASEMSASELLRAAADKMDAEKVAPAAPSETKMTAAQAVRESVVKKTNANSAMVWQIIHTPSGEAVSGPPGTYPGKGMLEGTTTSGNRGWKTKREADAALAELNRAADGILGAAIAPVSQPAQATTAERLDAGEDPFKVLFGDSFTDQQAAPAGKQFQADRVKSVIAKVRADVQKQFDDWNSRSYKQNKTSIIFKGDGPTRDGSMSIGAINENRRQGMIESLGQELGALDRIEEQISTDAGVSRFASTVNGVMAEATRRVDAGNGLFKEVNKEFEYLFIDSVLRIKPPKGNYTSNEISRAVLAALESPSQPAQDSGLKDGQANTGNSGDELTYNKRNRIKTGIKWADIADKDVALRIKDTNKQNVSPRPDYQAMVDGGMQPIIAHVVKQAYDAIATTPKTGSKVATDENLKTYIEGVRRYMDGVMSWANNEAQTNQWIRKIGTRASASLGAMRGQPTALTSLTETTEKSLLEAVYPNGWREHEAEVRIIGANKVLAAIQPGMDDAAKAMKDIGKGWPSKQEAWQKQGYTVIPVEGLHDRFHSGTHMDDSPYTTAWLRTGKGVTVDQQSFDGPKETAEAQAKEWAAQRIAETAGKFALMSKGGSARGIFDTEDAAQEHARELTKREAKTTQISDKGISVESAEREGVEHRMSGEDITSDQLKEAFGLRGVNFGTWMLGETPALRAERQLHLNHAYDSLMDLAEIMGVPPKAMSLDGLLGLAIGAQGNGKYAAHFVPGVNEINLTRTSGAGSLAHEWGHALDHYFARQAGLDRQTDPFLTEHATGSVTMNRFVDGKTVTLNRFGENIRPEIIEAFKGILTAMNKRKMTQEEHDANRAASLERSKKNVNGWLRSIRMDYERTAKPDAKEAVLTKFDALAERIKALDLGDGKVAAGGGFAMSQTVSDLRDLYKTISSRVYSLDQIKGLQSNVDGLKYQTDAKTAGADHVPNVTVPSHYAAAAAALDKDKAGKKYWSTDLEKFARAFDAFVSDSLEEKASKNTYLSHAGRSGDTVPSGVEREAINVGFKTLVDTIQTKDTERGTMLFSRSGAQSRNGEKTRFTRTWYDRLVSLLPESYRGDSYRREPLPASGGDVQRTREVQGKVDALNRELRGPKDTKGYGPVNVDLLGNLQVDARDAAIGDVMRGIKALADETGYGVVVTGVQTDHIRMLRGAGFESEISLAAVADRLTGALEREATNITDVRDTGTIMSYKPRGFPMVLFSRGDTSAKLVDGWNALAQGDGISKSPKSSSTDLPALFAEVAPGFTVIPAKTTPGMDAAWRIYPNGKPYQHGFILAYKDGRVELNLPRLNEGDGGSSAYAATGNWALNAGRKFAADRYGLSQIGEARRLENLASLAVKFGTTKFMEMDVNTLGVDWTDNDQTNISNLLTASYERIKAVLPEIDNYDYDFSQRQFVTSTEGDSGVRVVADPAKELVGAARAAGLSAGSSTIQRAILTGTLIRGQGLLQAVRETINQGLPGNLRGLLYGQGNAAPLTPITTIREALSSAYGKLSSRLEAKGLLTIHQTQDEALQAAAQARADVRGTDVATELEAMGGLQAATVWHGSPHKFDKFDSSKIGTGEGAQVYGHGLYLADSPEVAKGYKTKLEAGRGVEDDDTIARLLNALGGDTAQAAAEFERRATTSNIPGGKERMLALADRVRSGADPRGALYKVDLPDEHIAKMLDWDKPLSQQSPGVLKKVKELERFGTSVTDADWSSRFFSPESFGEMTGAAAYGVLEKRLGANGASEFLKSLGIPGIRYLDGVSRARTDGELIDVSQKNGQWFSKIKKTPSGQVGDVIPMAPVVTTSMPFKSESEARQWAQQQIGGGTSNYVVFPGNEHLLDIQQRNGIDIKRSADGHMQGFHDTITGKSFLVSDHLTAETAPGVLIHEIGVHAASDGALNPMHDRASELVSTDKSDFMREVARRMDAAGETTGEEAAAYITEAYENNRLNAPKSVRQWVKDYIAAIRGWLYKKGILIAATDLTPADIAAIARANARQVAKDGAVMGEGGLSMSESGESLSPGEDFWRKIKAGESFTEKELEDVYSQGRRGTERAMSRMAGKTVEMGAGPGEEIAAWAGTIAGFDGYRTVGVSTGEGTFIVGVIPEEIFRGGDSRSVRETAIVTYEFTPDGDKYRLDVGDPLPTGDAFAEMQDRGTLESTGDRDSDGQLYFRAKLEDRYTTSRALLQESVRRLALHAGKVPTIIQGNRETGARADLAGNREYSADRVEMKFSGKGDQTNTAAFKRWFGDSKVVDEQGKPLVVYHGTTGEVTVFEPYWKQLEREARPHELQGNGSIAQLYKAAKQEPEMHFAAERGTAESYGQDVVEAYLQIENMVGSENMDRDEALQLMLDNNADGAMFSDTTSSGQYGGVAYVIRKSNQAKSATGNNGDFDGKNPDIRYSRSLITGQTNRQYDAAQLQAMKNVGFQVEVPTLQERAQALWKDAGKKMAQGIVDQFAPIKDISKEAYGLMRLSKGSSGAFEVLLNGGKLKLTDGVYDFDDANKGGVVETLLIPLQGEHHDFMRWVAANRAERLLGDDKEHLFTQQDVDALKTLASGTTAFDYTIQNGAQAGQTTRDRTLIYRDSLATFNAFNKNVLDLAEQSGLIDPESRKIWEHEFYVPFYRVADDDAGGVRGMSVKGGVVRQQAFKTLKGGKNALNADLLDNTLMNWAHLLDAAAKNRAAKATIEAAEAMGVATGGNQSTLASMGASVNNKNGVVWYMDGGQKRYSLIDDADGPYLMTAITALEYSGMRNPVMNAMGAMKHALTVGVTASPFFKIRNLIRDSMQAVASGPISYNPAKNLSQGWGLTNPKSDEYMRLMAGGGTIHFGTMMEGSEAKRVQALVESGVDDATILNGDHKVKAFYRKFIEPGIAAYNELGNRGEAINRAALYDQLRKQGVNHADASLQARDLMDFSMQGSFTTIRFLAQTVPFFNARIVGLYKLGRAAKEDPARMSAVIGAAAVMSLSLLLAYREDDDWKKREEWDRNSFWWFKFGGTAFRIPKPFEVGAIATLAERGFELAFEKEMTGKRFTNQVLTLLGDNLSMNPVPQLVKPMLDVYANKNSFTGRPIETMGMDRLKSEYRFTDRTSMAARAASTGMNAVTGLVGKESLSPVQIDSLLRGYFGWLGSFVVSAGDVVARPLTDQPSRPTPDYWKTATGGMIASLDSAPSRYVSSMYEQAKEIEQAYATWRAILKEGKTEDAREFLADNKDSISRYHKVEAIKRNEAVMNQRIKIIERSNMSADQKRDLIINIQSQKDRMARMAVN